MARAAYSILYAGTDVNNLKARSAVVSQIPVKEITGVLGFINGGTGTNVVPPAGSIPYGDGNKLQYINAPANRVLVSGDTPSFKVLQVTLQGGVQGAATMGSTGNILVDTEVRYENIENAPMVVSAFMNDANYASKQYVDQAVQNINTAVLQNVQITGGTVDYVTISDSVIDGENF